MSAGRAAIRAGIGGWTYPPWRGLFYPSDLTQKRELEYASRAVTMIEVNGTFYRTQARTSFIKWRDETPEDFVFSLKAPRYATHRTVLAEAGESVARFIASGIAELGEKLGPLVWSFAPTKQFDPDDFEAFLKLLPAKAEGLRLRHVVDVRHESYASARFIELVRRYGVVSAYTDSPKFRSPGDVTSDFVYARLKGMRSDIETGYTPAELDAWAERARTWARGGEPADLPRTDASPAKKAPRDVYMLFINGAKERAPAAAQGLLERLASGA